MSTHYDEAKLSFTIPQLASKLGQNPDLFRSKKFRNPFRDDRNPSMWLWEHDRRAHDGSTGDDYDIGDWYRLSTGCTEKEAPVKCAELLLGPAATQLNNVPDPARGKIKPTHVHGYDGNRIKLPGDLRPLNEEECRKLAELRGLSPGAFDLGTKLGCLFFGTVCGKHCWLLSDTRGLIIEARRMNGKPFPAIGDELPERKSHTLAGSIKSWPVGLSTLSKACDNSERIIIGEGMPGYVELIELVLNAPPECGNYSVASVLGAGVKEFTHELIGNQVISMLKFRKEVRVFGHNDESGQAAADRWVDWLQTQGVNALRVKWPDDEFKDLGEVLANFKDTPDILSDFAKGVLS